MLFEIFQNVAQRYPDQYALNYMTYEQLLNKVLTTVYVPHCTKSGIDIIIDILAAARAGRPLIIPPKSNCEQCLPAHDLLDNEFGLILYSSGSTGLRRTPYFIPEAVLLANSTNAQEMQRISNNDCVLTVCSLHHTGGLNMQSLPGLLAGAHIIVENFSPYTFFNSLYHHKITITHLVPVMIDALQKLKNQPRLSSLTRVVAGSDCIKQDHVQYWLDKNIKFTMNYGLTQAGPAIINHEFSPGDCLDVFTQGIPLGTKIWSEYKINNHELLLKGSSVAVKGWLNTDDCVIKKDSWFYYQGRLSAGCKLVPKRY